jgi:cytidylate kinase
MIMAILTISREYGSGGREIARRLAQRLNYKYVDKEQLFQDLDRVGKRWGQAARELDEVCPTFWERHDWQYHGYITLLESLILDYSEADNVVIIGRGAFLLLQDVPFCLKVRLEAPPEVRLERIMVKESLSREKAEDLMARVDRDRACYLQANYGKAWDEESSYDCVFNTGSQTYDQVVEVLLEKLAKKESLATSDAKAYLTDLALAHRLKAKIATDPHVMALTLKVSMEAGTIVVSGVIHTPKELHRVQEIAREVAGAKPLRLDLHHRL